MSEALVTLGDLVRATAWSEVKAALIWLFPGSSDHLHDYKAVFQKLRRMRPVTDSMRIYIEARKNQELDEADVTEVIGRDGTLNRELDDFKYLTAKEADVLGDKEVTYSLCLRPWSNWLGMTIDPICRKRHSAAQVVAYCLDEMTFHGFAEHEIEDFSIELNRRVAEVDAMTPEEREEKLISADELIARLRTELDGKGEPNPSDA